jgi:biopolymer transport protein ExbD
MRHSKQAPQVNAGSMADIAFLLLIFFLVTAVIPNDQGINRKLPRICPPGLICDIDIHERNILRIAINGNQEIMVNEDIILVKDIKDLSKKFLDNNGDKSCDYCRGQGLTESSDNPKEAVISFQVDNETQYSLYVKVQDELTKAYYELRANYEQQKFGKTPNELTADELKIVRESYPFLVSEATID